MVPPARLRYNRRMPGRVVILLAHGDAAALRAAGGCALAAVAMDDRVDVFLTGPAVPAVVAAREAEAGEPGALLHEARRHGARLVACSASVVEQRVDLGEAEAALDAVAGWPTILEWSRGVVDRFSF